MAKSKKTKPKQPQLSPEAYIRTKARSLPLYECLLNSKWKEDGMAEVVVSRIHVNGNITFGVYMVDLFCMGVKDTFFNFNVPLEEYKEMVEQMTGPFSINKVEYALVHNIIFASLEYAGDLGFKAPKEYNQTTKYILEEDTEAVELIEIECGKNGKPLFVATDFYTPPQISGIINQLNAVVGEHNFEVIYEQNSHEEDDDSSDDWGDDEDELFDFPDPELIQVYDGLTPDVRRDKFLTLYPDFQAGGAIGNQNELLALSESIFANDVTDEDEVNQYLDKWADELLVGLAEDEYSAELLGISPEINLTEADFEEFDKLDLGLTEEDKEEMTEEEYAELEQLQMQKFIDVQNKWGYIPYLKYIEMKRKDEADEFFAEKLKACLAEFPDYPLFKIEMFRLNSVGNSAVACPDFKYFFGNKTEITCKEMFEYQIIKIINMINKQTVNYSQLEAQSVLIEELDLFPEYYTVISRMLLLSKVSLLSKYYSEK